MKSTTREIKRKLVAAGFSDTQTLCLLDLLAECGLIVSADPDHDLNLIDDRLTAVPFVPFVIRCGKTDFAITEPGQARWTRAGSLEIRPGDGSRHLLSSEHVELIGLAQGKAVTIVPNDALLTTQDAADLLQVSRPFLIKLLEKERVLIQKVGNRRKISFQAIEQLKAKLLSDSEQALRDLSATDAELNLPD